MNLKKPFAFALLLGLSHTSLHAAPAFVSAPKAAGAARVPAAFGRLPLLFEKNQGQFDPSVRFLSRSQGASLVLKSDEAVLELQPPHVLVGPPQLPGVLKMKLVGANEQPLVSPIQPLPTKVNYWVT